jgi:bile acid:Na+ symporter, BASS family
MDNLHFVDILVSLVLGLVMFGVGLALSAADFRRIVRQPKALFFALASQLIALPIISFLIAWMAPVPPEIKVGLVILAASPGGATSGLVAHLFKADTALSISMTTINSFICLFSIPIVVNIALFRFLGAESVIQLPFWETVLQIFSITIIPATLGVLLRRRFPRTAKKAGRPIRFLMLGLLAVVFAIKIFARQNQGGAHLGFSDLMEILPFCLIQNVVSLFFGYFFLKKMGFPHPQALTAAIESGVQNTTLSFLIAGTLLGNEEMVKPPLIYSMFSLWTAGVFCYFLNKRAGVEWFWKRLGED